MSKLGILFLFNFYASFIGSGSRFHSVNDIVFRRYASGEIPPVPYDKEYPLSDDDYNSSDTCKSCPGKSNDSPDSDGPVQASPSRPTRRGFSIPSFVRNLVSKKKKRYQQDGYDLDLAYITEKIIAMGYPAGGYETFYRNPYNEVHKFLETKYHHHYRVYNLCKEVDRQYDVSLFDNNVGCYPFSDHYAPTLELLLHFCEDIDDWLCKDLKNIAVVHCKAGKGRTGVMICAYLLYSNLYTDAEKCMEYYGEQRTLNKKGITLPSQRRYIHYFADIIKEWKKSDPLSHYGESAEEEEDYDDEDNRDNKIHAVGGLEMEEDGDDENEDDVIEKKRRIIIKKKKNKNKDDEEDDDEEEDEENDVGDNEYSWTIKYHQLPPNIEIAFTFLRVTSGNSKPIGFKITHFVLENQGKSINSQAFCNNVIVDKHSNITERHIPNVQLKGDVLILFYKRSELVCYCSFHTSFILVYIIFIIIIFLIFYLLI